MILTLLEGDKQFWESIKIKKFYSNGKKKGLFAYNFRNS